MATINYDFYDEKDIYNDGDIEEKLLKYFKNNKKTEFYNEDMFYTTTQIRENILNWYPFSKKNSILEIGAGVGPITEMLCEKCGSVVSVEASKRRAEIIYERCKDKKNLEIYVANLNDLELTEKFDYISLIGVFEYAKIFCNTSNPFVDFLNNIKKFLKPDGKILLAIENRYGIKYFAGNKEDHLNEKYVGLYGYGNHSVQTFGKKELISIFEQCSLNYNKFYYVFPDYKLPQVIYTDYKMPDLEQCYSLPIYNHGEQFFEFNPKKVLPGIVLNEQLDFFANSFLIEIGCNDKNFSKVAYVKHQPYRNPLYQTITIVDEKNNVYKLGSNTKAYKHLKDIYENHKIIQKNNINICDCILESDRLKFEYINGESIYEIINYNLAMGSSAILNIIDEYMNFIFEECSVYKKIVNPLNEKLNKIYKTETNILKVGLLDLNMGNVIKKMNKYYLIDQEWYTEKELPSDYAVYFSIKLLFETNCEISSYINENDLYRKYNITKEKQKIFNEISINYFDDYKKFKNNETFKKIMNNSAVNIQDINSIVEDISENYKNEIKEVSKNYENEIKKNSSNYENKIKTISKNYENEIKRLNNEIKTIYNSLSWKLTKPLRFVIQHIKK